MYLPEILGCAKISPSVKTIYCKQEYRLDTSRVPFKAFFRGSTLRWMPMHNLVRFAFVFTALCANPVQAAHCAPPGQVNVFKAAEGGSFIFYPSASYGDTVFAIPGEAFRKDAGAPPDKTEFFVDGIHYEFITTNKAEFIGASKDIDDATVLAKYAAYENRFAQSVGTTLTEFQDLGNREKDASQGNPKFTFKLWLLKNPKDPKGPRQYYLTTVVGDRVASLSAIIQDTSFEAQAMSAFNSFASSFQYVAPDQACPNLSAISDTQPVGQEGLPQKRDSPLPPRYAE